MSTQTSTDLRSFSFGGGVQSMAALVLAAQGRIDYRTFLFANVGDDSEDPLFELDDLDDGTGSCDSGWCMT